MKTRAAWLSMLVAAVALAALMAPIADAKKGKKKPHKPRKENSPLVIGHRGASGFVPEHTLQSYKLAIKLGADYIEPDLVATKDGVLIARHEPFLGTTATTDRDSTDVASHEEFANPPYKSTKIVDGRAIEGWFASDFTLAEIKTLGAQQTRDHRPTQFDGQFKVPTLQEIIRLVKNRSRKLGRRIGIYPETKHPTFHKDLGLPLEQRLVDVLKKNGLNSRRAPVFIQSFEQSNLKQLNTMTPVRLVQLMDASDTDPTTGLPIYLEDEFKQPYDWTVSGDPTLQARTFGFFATNEGLDEVKTYADGIGPWKTYIIPITGGGGGVPQTPTDLVARAHARGLLVHTWTFRDDAFPSGFMGGPVDELLAFYRQKVDGVFADFPDTAFGAREIFRGL